MVKDYYYILGVEATATPDQIKSAYRKLSKVLHPDKNNGDRFFTERFQEIQQAFDVLTDVRKKEAYDKQRNSGGTERTTNSAGPRIEFFRVNPSEIEYGDEITFSWKTVNAGKVILKPFGPVESAGHKSYRIKDFKNETLTFMLLVEDTRSGKYIKATTSVRNKLYGELYSYFGELVRKEEKKEVARSKRVSQERLKADQKRFWFVLMLVLGFLVATIVSQLRP